MIYNILPLQPENSGYFRIDFANGRSVMHLGTLESAHESAKLQTEETFAESDRVWRDLRAIGTLD